jgi:hydroxyacylglutathione hydrolase
MPFRGDSTRNEVDIAEKELINVLLSIYFSNCCTHLTNVSVYESIEDMAKILTVNLGFVSLFLIEAAKGRILVDAGASKKADRLWKTLEYQEISPEEIRLVIITHVHYDHVGFLPEVLDRTGADLLVHTSEAPLLREGRSAPVHLTSKLMRLFMPPDRESTVPAAQPTKTIDDEFSLEGYGLKGRVLNTPGHTPGSVSIIIDDEAAFVGDIVMRLPILTGSPFKPFVAEDMNRIYESWDAVLSSIGTLQEATIYPSHGKPFPAERLQQELTKIGRGSPHTAGPAT